MIFHLKHPFHLLLYYHLGDIKPYPITGSFGTKVELEKFREIDKKHFTLYLKECELRFNQKSKYSITAVTQENISLTSTKKPKKRKI